MNAKQLFVAVQIVITSFCGTDLLAQEKYPVQQLTVGPAQEGFPSWSPDGRTIVYSLGQRGDSERPTGLWKVSAQGGEPWPFTDFIGEHPDWSPDGYYIVFDAERGNSIKLISSRGGQPIRIVPKSIAVFRGGNPNWSPDSSRIAFREGSNLWVLDVRTGEATIVYSQENTVPIPGCWSHDGDDVYVTVRETQGSDSAIWRVSTKESEPRQVVFQANTTHRYLDLSPDGTLLAFTACEGRSCDLWIMAADGGKPVQLTVHPAYDDTPRWSPDGTMIAFTSTRSGDFDVWLIEPDIKAIRAELDAVDE
jgi:TolB protein